MKKIAYIALGAGLVLCLAKQENSPTLKYIPSIKASAPINSLEKESLSAVKNLEERINQEIIWRFYEKAYNQTPEELRRTGNLQGNGEESLKLFLNKNFRIDDYKGIWHYNEMMNNFFSDIEKALASSTLRLEKEYYANDFTKRKRIYKPVSESYGGIKIIKEDEWRRVKDLNNPPLNTIFDIISSQGESTYSILFLQDIDAVSIVVFETISLHGRMSVKRDNFIKREKTANPERPGEESINLKSLEYYWGLVLDQQKLKKGYTPNILLSFLKDEPQIIHPDKIIALYESTVKKVEQADKEKAEKVSKKERKKIESTLKTGKDK